MTEKEMQSVNDQGLSALFIERKAAIKPFIAFEDALEIAAIAQYRQYRRDPATVRGLAHSVCQLGNHPAGRNRRSARLTSPFQCAGMRFILRVQECKEVMRVSEDCVHFFGVPYR